MSLQALSTQMELYNVQSDTGWGEDIVYYRRSTSTSYPEKRAMVQDAEYGERRENYGNRDAFEDKKVFLSVELDFVPSKGDTITYDTRSWVVDKADGGNGVYDIYATAGTKHIGSRGRQ